MIAATVRLTLGALRITSAEGEGAGRLLRRLMRALAARYCRGASERLLAGLRIYSVLLEVYDGDLLANSDDGLISDCIGGLLILYDIARALISSGLLRG